MRISDWSSDVCSSDLLTEDALYWMAVELEAHPDADVLYSDEDKIDDGERLFAPFFKPDWSPELFLSQNMINHLGVYRRSLVEAVGRFRLGLEGSQDSEIGSAWCRERVCRYVENEVVGVTL